MILVKDFEFEAAHRLNNYVGACANLHGHTYKLSVKIEGEPVNNGMIIDFKDVKQIVNDKVIAKLDHAYINDLISQPTAENMIVWIWNNLVNEISSKGARLVELELYETRTSRIVYNGK